MAHMLNISACSAGINLAITPNFLAHDPVLIEGYRFARDGHCGIGQLRKGSGQPYIVHPVAVAKIVATVTDDRDMILAALFHDLIEDVFPVTREDPVAIANRFGDRVLRLTIGLTDTARLADGNRAIRVAMNRHRLANEDADVQTIKLADVIDNTSSVVSDNPNFAPRYLSEIGELLAVLVRGDRQLYALAKDEVQRARFALDVIRSNQAASTGPGAQ